MYFLYGIIYTLAFFLLLPRFIFDAIFKGKYAAGFFQRLGFVPKIDSGGKPVIWIHAVSVGEVNAARPLIECLAAEYPLDKIVVSTTTRTGQKLAKQIFADTAALVFYFPFDWRSTVRRALSRIGPTAILLMETEIWFNFVREANKSGARTAIVNGRLSERSAKRYGYFKGFMRRVLSYPEMALMQTNADAKRIMGLGMRANKVKVTGNLKFDHGASADETQLTAELRERFGISLDAPMIIAASTHAPEEKLVLDAFRTVWKGSADSLPRLMIAPRHPERFQAVADEIKRCGFAWVRRSEKASARDKTAEVILLDSIGELRAAYPLAEIVFVGGSLIPHGGQSILEPAASSKAVITGPNTHNFAAAVSEFSKCDALIQIDKARRSKYSGLLADEIGKLLENADLRDTLGANAGAVMLRNQGATLKTLEFLKHLLDGEVGG